MISILTTYLVPWRVRPERIFGCQHATAYYDANEDEIAPIRMCADFVAQHSETAIIVTIFCNSFYMIVQPPTLSDQEIIAKL